MGSFEKYPPSPRFSIGPLQIDLERGTVSGQGGAGGLTSRAEHLLLLLARYPNLLVTREQILETVWAGRVVEDAAITNCIWQIRKGIGERGKEVLQTRAKRGYVLMVADGDWILDAPLVSDTSVNAIEPSALPLCEEGPNHDSAVDDVAVNDADCADAGSSDAAIVPTSISAAIAIDVATVGVVPTSISPRVPRRSLRVIVTVLVLAAVLCGAVAWRFLRTPPDPIVLRPDVEMSMTVLAPVGMDWLRQVVLRSTVENVYLHGGTVVLFQKAQTRNPFAGPHLQVNVIRASKQEVEAELTLEQGSTVVRERFHGPGNALAEAVESLLTRTFGRPIRRPTPAVDALVSGWVAEQTFDHPRAIQEFRRAVARDPALSDAKIALASALLGQGQGNAALALVAPLLAAPRLQTRQRCRLDELLVDISPERLQARPCNRAARISRLRKLEMRELLREVGASQAPQDARQWLYDETAAVFAHIRLAEFDQAEARLVRAQRTASEAGWEYARIELGTLRSIAANHQGQTERGVRLQLDSADALEALGDVRGALHERTIGLRTLPVVPGPALAARRTELRAIVDRARAMGSVRTEIDALYLLVRLDRGRPDVWRVELARVLELIEDAYPVEQQTRDLHFALNEMRVQHRYGEVLDGVTRIERSGATQPQAQLWNLTLRAESHFALDELD